MATKERRSPRRASHRRINAIEDIKGSAIQDNRRARLRDEATEELDEIRWPATKKAHIGARPDLFLGNEPLE